jgi:hypothetical protein
MDADEAMVVLRHLLDAHPELVPEARNLAQASVAAVDPENVATAVEDAVRGISDDELYGRSGRHDCGYVEPNEAAFQLLEEAVQPTLDDMRRLIGLGQQAAAVATCQGIVAGLYLVRDAHGHDALEYADDFPIEEACEAVRALAVESRAKQGRAWSLPRDFLESVTEWKDALSRAAQGR